MKKYPSYENTGIKWNQTKPSHWIKWRGKRFFYSQKIKNKGNKEKNILSLTLKGVIRNNADKPIGLSPSDYSTYQVFEKNDLVFKLIDLNNISTSRVGLVPERGIMSSAYIRLTARQDCNIRYFFLQYYDLWLRNIYNGLGAGVRQTLSVEDLLELEIVIPPREEQDQIVRFLDWKVSEINRLINIKRKEIERLEELKKAVISHAVTLGLNSTVFLKNSGVNWLGEIPEHWNIVKLRQILHSVSVKNRPDLPLLSVVREQGVIIRNIEDKEANHNYIPDDLSNYKMVCEGQFAMNKMKAWQGSYGISPYTGIVSPAYFIFDVDFENLEYFHYAIRSKVYVNFFAQASDGIRIGQWDLQMDKMREIPFFVPPADEQKAIVEYIKSSIPQYEKAIKTLTSQIERLHEMKNRLISDVVTGKIDVRGIEIPEYEYTAEEDNIDQEMEKIENQEDDVNE